MSNKSINELLVELHKASVETLLKKVKAGEANAAELGRALEFLKHNGITASADDVNTQSLKEALGSFNMDDFNELTQH